MTNKKPNRLRKSIDRLLHPSTPVGGLEISESAVRFLLLKGEEEIFTISSRVPPGTLQKGKVENSEMMRVVLRDLHSKIASSRENISVIALVPPEGVYAQSFTLPNLEDRKLEEAAQLNLQMLSPVDIQKVYASWQVIEKRTSENQVELLACFRERDAVDPLINLLEECGFTVVAVEFPSLSIARILKEWGGEIKRETPYLVVRVTNEGIEMSIIRELSLHFQQFTPWRLLQEEIRKKEISLEDVTTFLTREVQRILSFYTGKWGGALPTGIVIAEEFEERLKTTIKELFGLEMITLSLTSFGHLPVVWFPALGGAARGLMPRGEDIEINLASASAQAKYQEEETILFTGLWRNIAIAFLGFFLAVIVGADSFLAQRVAALGTTLNETPFVHEIEEMRRLEAQVNEFNQLTSLITQASAASAPATIFVQKIKDIAGETISLKKVTITPDEIAINGAAKDEITLGGFKRRLTTEPLFKAVDIPPATIRVGEGGDVNFIASISLKDELLPGERRR